MILYPAIDIRGGQAVRLTQGDYERETTYDADPVDAARRWAGEGAEFLHVVDLDGAKAGEPRNLEAVRRIAAAVECPIQVGGGLRDAESVAAVLEAGAERVVIGTAALRDPAFLDEMLANHGDRIVVSVDARDGKVALAGWTEAGEEGVVEAVAALERARRRALPLHRDRGRRDDGGAGARGARPDRSSYRSEGDRLRRRRHPAAPRIPRPRDAAPTSRARSSAAPSTSAGSPSPKPSPRFAEAVPVGVERLVLLQYSGQPLRSKP